MLDLEPIGWIRTDFPTKFGIPRQSGLVGELSGTVVFAPQFRDPQALKGLDGFSHLWLIWEFSENKRDNWSPTVRPPRLGGNKRVGVFATRSPFRPNPIGLSCVRLKEIRRTEDLGTVLIVSGADLMDGTPILDIKPYLPLTDCHTDAVGGFASDVERYSLEVVFPEKLMGVLPEDKQEALIKLLSQDPRPHYHNDPERVYGFGFSGFEVKFRVSDGKVFVVGLIKQGE